ncbi:hypothetical protein NDU88_009569 [Pleurodeles waltl]|uniref:Uncharacterized protein n=1 Tax=Pleurodeles waltl TaxID=8319 RepID=A0AAV7QT59_PLEWA|nr:hypothetical protein NDU88_009569 [Pleurodeles waltl]
MPPSKIPRRGQKTAAGITSFPLGWRAVAEKPPASPGENDLPTRMPARNRAGGVGRAIARAAVLRSRREAGNLAAKTFGPRRHAGVDEVAVFLQNFHTKLPTDLRLGPVPLVSPHVGRQLRYWVFQNRY